MKSVLRTLPAVILVLSSCGTPSQDDPVDLVDTMIGTGEHGHTYPGATVPRGAVQLSPDTRRGNWDACAGYHYTDSTIDGFSHTHLNGTGCIDLGDILVRPTHSAGPLSFSHSAETSAPGYYRVTLPDIGVTAELTATAHAGIHRYTYPSGAAPEITFDLTHSLDNETIDSLRLTLNDDITLTGLRATTGWTPGQQVYFTARFSAPVVDAEILGDTLARLTFAPDASPLTVAVGLSGISADNARLNLDTEVTSLDFDSISSAARDRWADALSVITVDGGSRDQRRMFYTALYHSMVTPNLTSDVNGQWRRNDNSVGMSDTPHYSTFSLWDTFRAWNPLMTVTEPGLVSDMINSMLDMYDDSGELPIWPLSSGETGCMIGYHSVPVITDAFFKGIGGFDPERALEAMIKSSDINAKGSAEYVAEGYIPANRTRESVSCTLEYAYDDWCIARMAEALGHDDVAERYYRRAANYANVFDGSTRFFRGRRDDGNWMQPFDPAAVDRALTEATPWHYRFFAPHDVTGLISLFGGVEPFTAALDSLFSDAPVAATELSDITGLHGQYAHGNEPSHHMPYLYNYIGQPWKTQELTRTLLDEMYQATPGGLCGNEDCGQMSAWFIFSSLGFYPVCPGSGQYVLTTPLFEKATIRLPNGKTLTVTAPGAGSMRYISEVTLNGTPVTTNFITHDMIMDGGQLDFVLSAKPDTSRGTSAEDAPYSMSLAAAASVPYVTEDLYLFIDSIPVTIASVTPGAEIRYTLDGSEPTRESALYTAPLTADRTMTIRARAYADGLEPSGVMTMKAVRGIWHPATAVNQLTPGVRYTYTEGTFANVAEMSRGRILDRGMMPQPDITGAPAADHFGYIFTGYIDCPADGLYTFMTASDDGSVLEIDGETVVNNDGSHAAIPATGKILLRKGLHPFTLRYFEDYEGEELSWGWQLPGALAVTPIPSGSLYVR